MELPNYNNVGHSIDNVTCSENEFQNYDRFYQHSRTEIDIENYGSLYQDASYNMRLEFGLQYCDSKTSETSTTFAGGMDQNDDFRDFGDTGLIETKSQLTQTSATSVDTMSSSTANSPEPEPNDDDLEQKLTGEINLKATKRMIYFGQAYRKYLIRELRKEFNTKRFLLNHFEFVDFTIFEYGDRGHYLVWRVFCMIVIFLLSAHVFQSTVVQVAEAAPYTELIYMHNWLHILLIFQSVLEVISLTWSYYRTPLLVLGKIHYTPGHFKVIWFLYNVLCANLMSCNFMYYIIIHDMESYLGDYGICNAVMASFICVQVTVTAKPSRLAHIVHPLGFNIVHILFTILYQGLGFTNPRGQHFVYQEIDWLDAGFLTLLRVVLWVCVTCASYLLIVVCGWCRRLVYRFKRTKLTTCVYGISTEEYFLFKIEPDHLGCNNCLDSYKYANTITSRDYCSRMQSYHRSNASR